jgi:hypothetical protein
MTPTQILTRARNKYNAIGDSFFSDEELLGYLHDGCMEINQEAKLIERTYTTSSVANQQEYDYPGDTIAIKRLTYNGKKLEQITMRDDDLITGFNQSTTDTGTPSFYYIWNDTISLRPIPSANGDTIKVWSFNEPAEISSSSTIEIPTQYHKDLVYYIVMEMATKDKQFNHADTFERKWERAKLSAKAWARKKNRGDGFGMVQLVEPIDR